MNNNRDTFTDQKRLQSSDVKDDSQCVDTVVKENKTTEAVDEDKNSSFVNSSNESVLVNENFADCSTGCSENKTYVDDADNTNSSNALTNSRTLHFSINKHDKLQKLVVHNLLRKPL